MKSIKGILIDPFAKTVTDFDLNKDGGFEEINTAIGSHTFTSAAVDHESDTLYVDDEGLFKENQKFFFLPNFSPYQPLAGKGLIVGIDDEGDSSNVKTTLQEIQNQILWYNNADEILQKGAV